MPTYSNIWINWTGISYIICKLTDADSEVKQPVQCEEDTLTSQTNQKLPHSDVTHRKEVADVYSLTDEKVLCAGNIMMESTSPKYYVNWLTFLFMSNSDRTVMCIITILLLSNHKLEEEDERLFSLKSEMTFFFISFQSYKHNFAQACLSKEMFLMWTMWPKGLLPYFRVDMIWNILICNTYQSKFQLTHTIFKRENTLCRP